MSEPETLGADVHPETTLLPWYVNGTLETQERQRVAAHLESEPRHRRTAYEPHEPDDPRGHAVDDARDRSRNREHDDEEIEPGALDEGAAIWGQGDFRKVFTAESDPDTPVHQVRAASY